MDGWERRVAWGRATPRCSSGWAGARGAAFPRPTQGRAGGPPLPQRSSACAKLAAIKAPFAPTPKDIACTEIYGGPAEALVTGRFRDHFVRARFSRRDGCEIGRWNRVRFLFPGAVASAGS